MIHYITQTIKQCRYILILKILSFLLYDYEGDSLFKISYASAAN
jgi:hypothetical protein